MIPTVVHNTNDFSWHPDHNCFTAEASDFGAREPFNCANANGTPGFHLVSAKTGNTVLCTLESYDEDREGDIAGWRFKPCMELRGGKWRPFTATWKVLIIND